MSSLSFSRPDGAASRQSPQDLARNIDPLINYENKHRLSRETHLLACREEHDRLGVQVRLDEGPQHVELLLERAHDRRLVQLQGGRSRRLRVHADVLRVLEAQPREVPHRLGLGGAEEEGLAAGLGEEAEDRVDGGGEAHVEDSVRLVKN